MSSLAVATAQAIAFLTRPLVRRYPAPTVVALQMHLEPALTAYYATTWAPSDPLRGSGRRCMTLSPDCLPPKVIYSACAASGVQWFDWIALLGNRDFDFFVDPGCVSVRYADGRLVTVWADEVPSPVVSKLPVDRRAVGSGRRSLLKHDKHDDDDDIFIMINDEVHGTRHSQQTWISHPPSLDMSFLSARSHSPLSTLSSSTSTSSSASFGHSRCSSRASNSSSDSTTKSAGSRQSRRERARQAKVFIDTSRTEVAVYEGGNSTVLTGGVMLGGGPKAPSHKRNQSWRAPRA